MNDIYSILARLDAVSESKTTPSKLSDNQNSQQKSVPQLPALFKPRKIAVLGAKTDPDHPMRGYAVGANESEEQLDEFLPALAAGAGALVRGIGAAAGAATRAAPTLARVAGATVAANALKPDDKDKPVDENWRKAAAAGALAAGMMASPAQATDATKPITVAVVTIDGETRTYNLGDRFKTSKEAEKFISDVLDKQGLSGYSLDIRTGYTKDKQKTNEEPRTGIMSISTPSQVPDKYAMDPGEQLANRVTGQFKSPTSQTFPINQNMLSKEKLDTSTGKKTNDVQEQIMAAEDMLGKIRRDLSDYLRSVEDELVGRDRALIRKAKDEIAKPDIEKFLPVRIINTDDGKVLRIHGNEDDGFRITMQEKMLPTAFESVEEASMACEMYCARRRGRGASTDTDYVEERGTDLS